MSTSRSPSRITPLVNRRVISNSTRLEIDAHAPNPITILESLITTLVRGTPPMRLKNMYYICWTLILVVQVRYNKYNVN